MVPGFHGGGRRYGSENRIRGTIQSKLWALGITNFAGEPGAKAPGQGAKFGTKPPALRVAESENRAGYFNIFA